MTPAASQAAADANSASTTGLSWQQRTAAAACGLATAALLVHPMAAAAGEAAGDLVPYVNEPQRYSLAVPSGWEKKEKAGADVLFEDPSRRSTSVGVTVSPVRVESIQQFGTLEAVGRRLLDAEAKKESTLDVAIVGESERSGRAGALLYAYEYELSSTRGRKRIVNTVTITGSKLYILNGQYKCDKEACGPDEATQQALGALRAVASSFDAGVAGGQ